MKAELIVHDKVKDSHGGIVEIKIWAVPEAPDKPHGYKYSLVYVRKGERIIGYDNAEGKGDHRHYKGQEAPYVFTSPRKLIEDFYRDVQEVTKDES